jgi:hypothetical protein
MMKYAWILVAVLTFATLTVAYPFAMFLF